jgi:hypothetical protein
LEKQEIVSEMRACRGSLVVVVVVVVEGGDTFHVNVSQNYFMTGSLSPIN